MEILIFFYDHNEFRQTSQKEKKTNYKINNTSNTGLILNLISLKRNFVQSKHSPGNSNQ